MAPGVKNIGVWDRAVVSNMSPEYGATLGYFPPDEETIAYLHATGRDKKLVERVEAYLKAQDLFVDAHGESITYSHVLHLDLASVKPSVAGPKRPQDRVPLGKVAEGQRAYVKTAEATTAKSSHPRDGDVVIAAITSCTNTSNPTLLLTAGLLAKNAVARGLHVKPWVKTSFAPGSRVVHAYMQETSLQDYLDMLGFQIVAYGCTSCIGNSGPLAREIEGKILGENLYVNAVLSGNRNFEGRVHPLTKGNYLMSPPLVVLYALTGSMLVDLTRDPVGLDQNGEKVYLKDLWPHRTQIEDMLRGLSFPRLFKSYYGGGVTRGDAHWKALSVTPSERYDWNPESTYIRQQTPFFENIKGQTNRDDISGARALLLLGDSVTTDHISPAGSIPKNSPAGIYLREHGVKDVDFNTYGARRGNPEVMQRGTFANIRIKNLMLDGREGGYTRYIPSGNVMSVFEAAEHYAKDKTPLIVVAGAEYGTGSSRDWAAKGPKLLGVRAVVAESFERIHRANLAGMGILPLQLPRGVRSEALKLTGDEMFHISGLGGKMSPKMQAKLAITYKGGRTENLTLLLRLDTETEVAYYLAGGILPYVANKL